ncbi:MAG: glycoside hydrolase family 38 C-terminal domain-containing protein [Caulobacteraceae bacterium]|nr:glycoside hydrolase family 38 C-terminal domain-containing protein [Caulobacteraceae bacterium]
MDSDAQDGAQDGRTDGFARTRGRYPGYTRARLEAFAHRLERLARAEQVPVEAIEVAGPTDRIRFAEAQALDWRPAAVGEELGPLWSTWWFRVTARVPEAWAGQVVELKWDSRSEALLWLDGRSAQGLNIGRGFVRLSPAARGGETLVFHVEVACNRSFGASENWDQPHSLTEPYRLAACEIVRFDPEAWTLSHDVEALRQLEADRTPPQTPRSFGGVAPHLVRPALDTTWAGRLLHDLNRVCNLLDPEDRSTWPAGQAILRRLLAVKNSAVVHELSAIGHAHIDTAWLWPIEETRRKCQRSFSTAVHLMDLYPEFKFACSQAYQYAVIEETDPDLFRRIRAKAEAGQWIPVGGSWVEPDCNLPSGESLTRQFLYGQRYFERTFGARATVFWNPDVFGYAGQLPQIIRQAGMTRFLTQKLSWNKFTSPPHHSFRWRGIDGSEVLTHFPPVDTYNATASLEELRYHAANYKDADRSADALYLFGHGDGGGGPDAGMIETLRRTRDLLGAPRCETRSPDAFFDRLETTADDLAVIEGELYFEYHRGTYTSQAEVKRLNRLCEGRLQTLDYLAAACGLAGVSAPSRDMIEALWRVLLTNQFHDILPGSSIHEVYQRSLPELAALADQAAQAADDLLARLTRAGGDARPVNPTGFERAEVTTGPDGAPCFIRCGPFSAGEVSQTGDRLRVTEEADGRIRLENGQISAVLTPTGGVARLTHKASGREALSGEANRIVLFEDRPIQFEAWDIDPFALETAREAQAAHDCAIVSRGPLRAEVRFERKLGKASRMVQTVRLDAGSGHLAFDTVIDWRDRRTLVKAVFPLASRARSATYETMFGAVERPTHANTDADLAQFEVPGHRWADLSEPGFGVALLSDARYGFSTFGQRMALSLVRGTQSPDPRADIGEHRFAYALYPHAGDWREAGVVAEAMRFNRPVLWAGGAVGPVLETPLASVDAPSVVIDTIKPAEDGDGWVVRLYESGGGHARARLRFGVPVRSAWLSNGLEDRLEALPQAAHGLDLDLRPFQIMTLRLL